MTDAINKAKENTGSLYCVSDSLCAISNDGKTFDLLKADEVVGELSQRNYGTELFEAKKIPNKEFCNGSGCIISPNGEDYIIYNSKNSPNDLPDNGGVDPKDYFDLNNLFEKPGEIIPIPINTASAPSPSEIRTNIAVSTAGLGTSTNLGQNPTPVRPQFMQVQILNPQGQVLKDAILPLLASQASGSGRFNQLLSLGSGLSAGKYKTRVKLDNTLWKTIDTNFTPGTQTNIPPIELVLGDIDQDNSISLTDYNLLIACLIQKNCARQEQSDLNLDGKIDEIDLNLLYNSFKARRGD